jgi:hypothetical protein
MMQGVTGLNLKGRLGERLAHIRCCGRCRSTLVALVFQRGAGHMAAAVCLPKIC